MLIDPRNELLSDLDNSKTRVINKPNYIVICGGPVSVSAGLEASSARNLFLNYLCTKHPDLASKHRLPEQFVEWNHDGIYPDLLTFETDLAHLMGAVVIFVESEGSIAELGSFSCIPPLAKKLRVVMREEFYKQDSFITYGPIKFLENVYPDSISIFDWNESNTDFERYLPDLTAELRKFLDLEKEREQFSPQIITHVLLLIADLIDLFVIATASDLQSWLLIYFQVDLDDKKIQRYLFLLTKLQLINKAPYGTNRFYVAPIDTRPYIEYGTNSNVFRQDRAKLKAKLIEFYSEKEHTRHNAWKNSRAGGSDS